MNKVRIIISSTVDEAEDIMEVKAFFGELNSICFENGLFFAVDYIDPDDSRDIREIIKDCELAFLLFYKKVGDNARHSFELALESFTSTGKPVVVPYFKYVSGAEEAAADIAELQEYLGNGLGHYYKSYENTDSLKLYMLMQIKLLQLDSMKLDIDKGSITLDGKEFVNSGSIPVFANNNNLSRMRDRLTELDKAFFPLKAEFINDQNNMELYERFCSVSS